jgi:DMSO reductase family type II enzyme chaperone
MTRPIEAILDNGAALPAGARSYVYGLAAEAFSFPDAGVARRLSSGAWLRDIESIALNLPFELPLSAENRAHLGNQAPQPAKLEEDYIRLFEVGAGKPFCPPYEGAHRNGRMKLMEDLVRFYEHFGLIANPDDLPDHICTELQFMHYLAFKEAAVTSIGGERSDLARAQHDFLDRHLRRWMPRLGTRLSSAGDPSSFYTALASFATFFVEADRRWLAGL